MEINKRKRKTIGAIEETKSWFFKKTHKSDKPLTKPTKKKKKRKHKIPKSEIKMVSYLEITANCILSAKD